MEYGYVIMDATGTKRFLVQGCTYCQMSTGGIHESNCPCHPDPILKQSANGFDDYGNPIHYYLS